MNKTIEQTPEQIATLWHNGYFNLQGKDELEKAIKDYSDQQLREYKEHLAKCMEDHLKLNPSHMFGRSQDAAAGFNDAVEFIIKTLRSNDLK